MEADNSFFPFLDNLWGFLTPDLAVIKLSPSLAHFKTAMRKKLLMDD